MKQYYLVVNGKIVDINMCNNDDYANTLAQYKCISENDGTDWIIVFAEDENKALKIADEYDAIMVSYGNTNCPYCGHTHVAVY